MKNKTFLYIVMFSLAFSLIFPFPFGIIVGIACALLFLKEDK